MPDWNRKPTEHSSTDLIELARDWILETSKKAASRAEIIVLRRPKATAAVGLAIILGMVALSWTGKAVGEFREKRHREWRLQQMTETARQADQRIRSRLILDRQEEGDDVRGVFETMRNPTEPRPATEVSPASESKP